MDVPRFAIGVAKRKTRQTRREDAQKAYRERRKQGHREQQRIVLEEERRINIIYKRLGISRKGVEPLVFRSERWFILRGYPLHVEVFMYHAGKSCSQIMNSIRRKKKYDKSLGMMGAVAAKNQRVRRAFESLARRWIRSRLQKGNEEDLMTGERPTNPVILTDWRARRQYVFEARTIHKDMITRLLMPYVTFFPKPRFPRNPYTNMDMTAGQFFDMVGQLRKKGLTHWTLEALYSNHYQLETFEKQMYSKLKENILRGIFSNHKDSTGIVLILEFIEEEHMEHKMSYDEDLYKWALDTIPLNPLIAAWRNLCYKYYRISNMIPAHPDVDSISLESRSLCRPPIQLERQRTKLQNSESSSTISL